MSKSHDAKPRNKHRRQKYQKERMSIDKQVATLRQVNRVMLRETYIGIFKAQQDLELALRKAGITWRRFEKHVHELLDGKWREVDEKFLAKVFVTEGVKAVAA